MLSITQRWCFWSKMHGTAVDFSGLLAGTEYLKWLFRSLIQPLPRAETPSGTLGSLWTRTETLARAGGLRACILGSSAEVPARTPAHTDTTEIFFRRSALHYGFSSTETSAKRFRLRVPAEPECNQRLVQRTDWRASCNHPCSVLLRCFKGAIAARVVPPVFE